MARFDVPPQEYPDHAGVKARMLPDPVDPPAPPDPAPPVATDRDGNEREVFGGLPDMPSRDALSPDERVPWTADLERGTLR